MIHTDKILHFLTGFFIATLLQFANGWVILIALLAGLGKELYDQNKGGEFDKADLACTVSGGFVAYILVLIYSW